MKLLLSFINIMCLKLCLSITNPSILQMIVDVVTSYEQPTSIVSKVCWNSVYKVNLARILAKKKQIATRYLGENDFIDAMEPNNHLFFIIDARCPNYINFLNQASANKMFNKTYRWLFLGETSTAIDELTGLSILTDSEFIIAEDQDNGGFKLQAVYKLNSNIEFIREYYGSWTTKGGLNKSQDRIISNAMRRKDLNGNDIATSFVIIDNRTRYDLADLSNTFIDPVTKSTAPAVNNLYDFLNASRVFLFTDTWGYLVNGTWTGMNQDIFTGKADLCGTVSFITKDRQDILEYITIPAEESTTRIVFRQPPLSYQFNLFLLPFTTGVWYSLGGLVLIFVFILYIIAKQDVKKWGKCKEDNINETYLGTTCSDIVMFVVTAISQQGSSYELKGALGRIVMFILFLTSLFLYTSYSASIVVLLQSTSDHIRTVTDLSNSKLELGIEDVVYNKFYFSEAYARDSVRKTFYETKISPKGSKPNFMSLEEGVKKIQTEPFAFSMNTGSGYKIVSKYFQEHEKCGLQEIDYIRGSSPWFCCKKGSPFTEMYRVGFFRIEEHGLSSRSNRIIFTKKPSCTTTSGNFDSVKMVDFYPVLLMMLYGMILSFVILFLEILIRRRQEMKESLEIN